MLTEAGPERSHAPLHSSQRPRRPWEHRDWTTDAACNGLDPEIFFPNPRQSPRPAKAACRRCPVIDHCLIDALGAPWLHGIWAYTNAGERARLRENLLAKNIRGDALREFARAFGRYVRTSGTDGDREEP